MAKIQLQLQKNIYIWRIALCIKIYNFLHSCFPILIHPRTYSSTEAATYTALCVWWIHKINIEEEEKNSVQHQLQEKKKKIVYVFVILVLVRYGNEIVYKKKKLYYQSAEN